LAVNHIADWDPSFEQVNRSYQVRVPSSAEPEAAGALVLRQLGIQERPSEIYASAPDAVDIVLEHHTLHLTPSTGHDVEEGQSPRFFLRLANWLHLNRGKKAWSYVADTYAVMLLYLAISGLFMIPGRKGLVGRGAVLALLGAAVPVGYVVFSGGPEAKNGSAASSVERARPNQPPP
jgi:hypothetical protein